MALKNEELAASLEHFADDLELMGENLYKVRAYRRAASSLRRNKIEVYELINQGHDITSIPYVGTKIAATLKKMIMTDNLILTISKNATEFLPEKDANKKRKQRYFKIHSVTPIIERIISQLKSLPEIKQIEATGAYRRRKEIIGDIDIIINTQKPKEVFEKFHQFMPVKYIVKITEEFTIVQLKIGLYLTLHNVSKEQFGANLLDLTGNEEHVNFIQQAIEKKQVVTINASEEDIYRKINLRFIPPELRENRGELEAAANNTLPKLIELKDIKGDLHSHTNETDGAYSLEEMVDAAIAQGYSYVAITDHSQSLKITNGMNEKRLLKQIEEINTLNQKLHNFVILKSMEIDILEDGRLDLSNEVLKELDLTVCSIHSKFKLSYEKQTERVIRAMDNPYFNILGHATGRLIQHRPPYLIDIERILQAARERNCFIEVNAQPARLDINDIYCKRAKEIGVKVAISSDAHTIHGFKFMILGVNQARRGWLEASDVINTYDLAALRKLIKRC